jgi:hypothetical protein
MSGENLPSGNGQTIAAKSRSVVPASDSPPWPTSAVEVPWSKSLTVALSANFVAKATAGRFRSAAGRLDATAPTGTYYVQAWDAAAAPADATVITLANTLAAPLKIQHSSGAEDYWEIEVPDPGVDAANGIVVGLSATEFLKTAAGAYLSATACFR